MLEPGPAPKPAGDKDVPLISIDIRSATRSPAPKELKPRIEIPPSSPGLDSTKSNKADKSLAKWQKMKLCLEMRSEKVCHRRLCGFKSLISEDYFR